MPGAETLGKTFEILGLCLAQRGFQKLLKTFGSCLIFQSVVIIRR